MLSFLFHKPADHSTIRKIKAFELEAYLKDPNIYIVDVRTKAEYTAGHIKNAINIDIYSNEFIPKLEQLDKTQAFLVYCKSGGRSSQASRIMEKMGFKSIINMADSFDNINESAISI